MTNTPFQPDPDQPPSRAMHPSSPSGDGSTAYSQSPNPDYGYQHPLYGQPPVRTGHSRLGIASMIAAGLAIILGVTGIMLGTVLADRHPDLADLQPGEVPAPELVGPMLMMVSPICFAIVLNVAGLILGIAGISQKARSKTLATIGTCANGLMLAGCLMTTLLNVLGLS